MDHGRIMRWWDGGKRNRSARINHTAEEVVSVCPLAESFLGSSTNCRFVERVWKMVGGSVFPWVGEEENCAEKYLPR